MRTTRSAVMIALGFFALVAQTVLFRAYLTAFEGNELGVGGFFGSWLIWVALGAVAGRGDSRMHRHLLERFPVLILAYLPAFLLQFYLTVNARIVAGVPAYELFPFVRMFGLSLLTNAPVSAVTGFLFTMGCRWWSHKKTSSFSFPRKAHSGVLKAREKDIPVARVYLLEALGGCAGGLAVTTLLFFGYPGETAVLLAGAVVALAAGAQYAERGPNRGVTTAVLVVAAVAAAPASMVLGRPWAELNNRAAWARLLPEETYGATFTTAQDRYLCGQRQGQFIVMASGGVSETLPDTERASEVAAVNLAQMPEARRILVVGPGCLSVCLRLRSLPQVERVVWFHPDPDYPGRLLEILPERFRSSAAEIEIPGGDVRTFLGQQVQRFDLVILDVPDAGTLVLNRYSTREFFGLLRDNLTGTGVVSIRLTGAANFMGSELSFLGASTLETLRTAFAHVALKPGDETWLSASNAAGLSESPAELRDRFADIDGASAVFPPKVLFSLYPANRIAFQFDAYRRAEERLGRDVLVNTDDEPRALLFSLLFALRRGGFLSVSGVLPVMLRCGVWLAMAAVALYGLLRLVYLLKTRRTARGSGVFDSQFLIFSTGCAAMSLSIMLMFQYQVRFGSLFLYIGLITSLYMLGAFLGCLVCERLLAARSESKTLLPVCMAVNLLFLLAVCFMPRETSQGWFAALFLVCGICTGLYFPIAARRMADAGRTPAQSGSILEVSDHFGGAAGAVATGLIMLPLFGSTGTLAVLGALVAVNLAPAITGRKRAPGRLSAAGRFDRGMRPAGYAMFGIAAFFVVVLHVTDWAEAAREGEYLLAAARTMAGQAELAEEQAVLADGSPFSYYEVAGSEDEPPGNMFGTSRLVEGVYGYAGPIVLAVHVDVEGALRGFEIVSSSETPAYLEFIEGWARALLPDDTATETRHRIFEAGALSEVDALTGATLTTNAILRTLETSGNRFGVEVLGLPAKGSAPPPARGMDREFICLALLTACAVVARFRPNLSARQEACLSEERKRRRFLRNPWIRRAVLLASLLVGGVWLNAQFSSQHVAALLGLRFVGASLTGPFFLVVMVPVITVLAGNVYCGYVCPFGAVQELLGDLRPRRFDTDPPKNFWRYGRFVKYVLLFLALSSYAVTRDFSVLGADPLTTIFGSARTTAAIVAVVVVLALSVVFRRFWCRNLCPAGAFLALLNGIGLARRFMPAAQPARCDMGVRTLHDFDCISCDRCNQPRTEVPEKEPLSSHRPFAYAVAALAIAFAFVTMSATYDAIETGLILRAGGSQTSAGTPRDIDAAHIKRLIGQGYLSDHEAQFYEPGAPTRRSSPLAGQDPE